MGTRRQTPLYDPFWARCQEAGIPVVFHLGNDGLTEIYSSQWSESPLPSEPPAQSVPTGDRFDGTRDG